MSKLAPFHQRIISAFRDGLKNDIYLYVGLNAKQKAHDFSPSRRLLTFLPPWEDPASYTWPVSNRDVLIIETLGCEKKYIHRLVYCLYIQNAKNVRSISEKNEINLFPHDCRGAS